MDMNFREWEPRFPERKKEESGIFVTKELEGKTFYSCDAAKAKGILKQLVIQEVGYTHTTLRYGKRQEATYTTGNQGKGAHIGEVLTFEEAQRFAIQFWEKEKIKDPKSCAEADEKIRVILATIPADLPKDPLEIAKDAHPEDLARWKRQVEKIKPLVETAKKNILSALKSDAKTYSESKGYQVSRIIKEITGYDPEKGVRGLIEEIQEAGVDAIEVTPYSSVTVAGKYFGKIEQYTTLKPPQTGS